MNNRVQTRLLIQTRQQEAELIDLFVCWFIFKVVKGAQSDGGVLFYLRVMRGGITKSRMYHAFRSARCSALQFISFLQQRMLLSGLCDFWTGGWIGQSRSNHYRVI